MESRLGLSGKLEMRLIRNGETILTVDPVVTITNVGFDALCDVISNSPQPAPFNYVAIGTSSTAPSASDTALGNEVMRQSGTYSHTAGTKSFTVSATFNITTSYTIWESGLFNASTGGTLLVRGVLDSGISVSAGDTLQVIWTITLAQA